VLSQQEISDHIEIEQVLQRYGMALDDKAYDLLDSVFTPDAELRYQMEGQELSGDTAHWKKVFPAFMKDFYWTQHFFSTPVVELEGDEARTTTRLIATHVQVEPGGLRHTWTVYGFYRDRFVRTDDGWRIRERFFKGPHEQGKPASGDRVVPYPALPWSR
jgi:hypothetical protein